MRIVFTFLLILSFITGAFAQSRTITGKVISKEDDSALPGVSVFVPGTTKGTTTDVDGLYSINLDAGDQSLSFSFVGFTTETITVGDQTVIDMTLFPDITTLQDVVVVGYGTQKKSDLTGSVSSLRGGDLTKIPSSSPEQALQGRLAGVQVTSASGAPGSTPVVRIRGVGTFNNTSPIYVVDGVILDNISFLNSADIESMEVLKDASSTAIYGSRGANGVIMITTKQGKQGNEAPTVNFSSEYSVQKLQKKIDLLNGRDFAIVTNEIKPGSYNNVDLVPNTDWQDQIFKVAPLQNYQLSVSGSSAKVQYYVGLGYFNQKGIIDKSNYERLSLRFNNVYTLSSHIKFGNNITLAPYTQQNASGNSVFTAYRAWPTVTPYTETGAYSPVQGSGNPLAELDYTNDYNKGLRMVGNVFGQVSFLKAFTFKSSFGVDMNYSKIRNFTPKYFVSPTQQQSYSSLNKEYNDRLSWLWENTLNYKKEIGKHRIDALAGFTMQESSSESLKLQSRNLLRDGQDFWYLNGSTLYPNETDNKVDPNYYYSMMSYLFRVNYVFNDKYLFTATYRRDGSSKFTPNNRYANFPALAVGWNIINEEFMQPVHFVTNLKLRGSWGIVGNEKIDYNQQYSSVTNNLNGVFGKGELQYPGASYGVTGNSGLKWENTYQTDIGLETGFFSNRLTAEIDYFSKTTKDILVALPVAGYLGNGIGATITYNAAEVLNRGMEFTLGWNGEIAKDFTYRIGGNFTTIHNEAIKVMNTGGDQDYLRNQDITTSTSPGLPIGAFYGYKTDGVFQNAAELAAYPHRPEAGVGDLRFVDTDNNGVLNDADRTYLGSPIPKAYYGFNGELNFKGFNLSADFQGQYGNKILNYKETSRPDLYNFEQHYINRWHGEGTSNTEPRASSGGYNFLYSSRFIQDGSFIRLRNVTLGYNLSKKITDKLKMKAARIYVRGTNIFTATKYTGYTPEVATNNPVNAGVNTSNNPSINAGIDKGTYPVTSIYSLGLNITF